LTIKFVREQILFYGLNLSATCIKHLYSVFKYPNFRSLPKIELSQGRKFSFRQN
jgi:hypothetical protein